MRDGVDLFIAAYDRTSDRTRQFMRAIAPCMFDEKGRPRTGDETMARQISTEDLPMAEHLEHAVDQISAARSVSPLEAIEVVGAIYWAAERGVFADLVAAYGRLLKVCGRTISDQPPDGRMLRFTRESVTWEQATRLLTIQTAIGPAIRNATAQDADRHWRLADGVMKGFCAREAEALEHRATYKRGEHDDLMQDGDEDGAIDALAAAVAADDESRRYQRLADGQGW